MLWFEVGNLKLPNLGGLEEIKFVSCKNAILAHFFHSWETLQPLGMLIPLTFSETSLQNQGGVKMEERRGEREK